MLPLCPQLRQALVSLLGVTKIGTWVLLQPPLTTGPKMLLVTGAVLNQRCGVTYSTFVWIIYALSCFPRLLPEIGEEQVLVGPVDSAWLTFLLF